MFTKILVPLDGSELSERAIPFAQQLAGQNGRLMLVRTTMSHRRLGSSGIQARDEPMGEAEHYLANVAERLSRSGADTEWRVYYGPAAEGIREEAALRRAGSTVMSTHGRSGLQRLVFGSVAEQVLHETEVPLLMVPARSHANWTGDGPKRVVVPLDGSDPSEAALEPAIRLAGRLNASLCLLGVIAPLNMSQLGYGVYIPGGLEATNQGEGYLTSVANRLRPHGLQVETRFEVGFVASAIADLARAEQTAAVVMATHGRAGLASLVMRSVTTNVLRHSMAPLLVVRPVAWQRVAESAGAAEAQLSFVPAQ